MTDTLTTLTTRTRVDAPNADAFLLLSVPIYDGGVRDAQLRVAEAQASAAAAELMQIQNAGAQEIVAAYDALRTSLAAFAAASELVAASKITAAAARDYYDHGLGTLTDATSAQTALLQAELAKAKAHSDALTAAATIAFASGALTNRDTLGSALRAAGRGRRGLTEAPKQKRESRRPKIAGERSGTDRHAGFALCAARRRAMLTAGGSVRPPADLAVPPHLRILEDQPAAEGADAGRRRRHGADRLGRHPRLSRLRLSQDRRTVAERAGVCACAPRDLPVSL